MDNLIKNSKKIGLILLYTMFIDLCGFTLLNFLRISNFYCFILPISYLLSLFFILKKDDKKNIIFVTCITLFIIVISIFLCSITFELAFDGLAYHKAAVGYLKNGWNPFVESSEVFCKNYFGNDLVKSKYLWIDHYGKASWYIGASLYSLTGNIESGKAYNLLTIFSLFFLSIDYLSVKKKNGFIIISLLICLNPVIVPQIFTYYVDGLLASLLTILLFGLVELVDDKISNTKAWSIIFPTMVILGNVKFTGLAYGGIICVIFYLYSVYRNRNIKLGLYRLINFIVTALVTIVVLGYTTYVINFLEHGNPLYPLAGDGKVDIMTDNSPVGFLGKATIFKLFYSIFGESVNMMSTSTNNYLPNLKIPFLTSINEIQNSLFSYDLRIGGFGVLFSGILIISLIIIIMFLCKTLKNKANEFETKTIIVISSTVICLLLFISDSWWARYSPYLYWCVIIAVYILFENRNKYMNLVRALFIILIVFNNISVSGFPVLQIMKSKEINAELSSLQNKTICLKIKNSATSILYNLEDYKIDYYVTSDEESVEDAIYDDNLAIRVIENNRDKTSRYFNSFNNS